ncbi:MAG: hypothetical protein V2I54_06235 [Bacteroidales bacterium]|jgi:hypothetical protein|nr:hypothetical protein [Bacteroidales bacterium]
MRNKYLLFLIIVSLTIFSSCEDDEIIMEDFSYIKYQEFLQNLVENENFIFVSLNEFNTTNPDDKIVIGLRHDVDVDLEGALIMAKIENSLNIPSTYYMLHTAKYYSNTSVKRYDRNNEILNEFLKIQNDYNCEIGIHNDLVTLEVVYRMNPVIFLKEELKWLRNNGIEITGTASHGSTFCHKYKYHNLYFFKETENVISDLVNFNEVPVENDTVTITKAYMSEFDLAYEAYSLNNNKYYSDCSFIEGERWNPWMLDFQSFNPGDKIIILTHPTHWH